MLSVSELLNFSVKTYKNHFGLLAGYIAWLLLPYATQILLALPKSNVFLNTLSTLTSFGSLLLTFWLSIFLFLLIADLIRGKNKILPTTHQKTAWQIIPAVIFVALIETAVFLGGFILLIVPAFVFLIWFGFSQQAVIFHNKRGLAALIFSRDLVRGKFWPVTWRVLVGPALIFMAAICLTGLLLGIFLLLTATPLSALFGITPPLWADAISVIIETFSLPLIMIYTTALYFDLVNTKMTTTPSSQPAPIPKTKEAK